MNAARISLVVFVLPLIVACQPRTGLPGPDAAVPPAPLRSKDDKLLADPPGRSGSREGIGPVGADAGDSDEPGRPQFLPGGWGLDSAEPSELDKLKEALKPMYPDPAVYPILLDYYQYQRVSLATEALERLAQARPDQGAVLGKLIEALKTVDTNIVAARAAQHEGKLDEADDALKKAAEANAKLLPKGFTGRALKMAESWLADDYRRLATGGPEDQERAFKWFMACDSSGRRDCAGRAILLREAQSGMERAPGCDSYRRAMRITPPFTDVYQAALEAATKANCPGIEPGK